MRMVHYWTIGWNDNFSQFSSKKPHISLLYYMISAIEV